MIYSIFDKILYTFILSTALTLTPTVAVDSTYFYDNGFLLSAQWSNAVPAEDAKMLQGTSFRFRDFVNEEAITETITATYVIAPNAAERFNNRPIIAITAPYDDFRYIYSRAGRLDITRRRIFNYEYFDLIDSEYVQIFSLSGSSSLGGNGQPGKLSTNYQC